MQEPRILIVEHDERVCRVLGRIIARMGYAALAAADYDCFKALYNEQVPAAILLNLEITGAENAEFCRYLVERKSPAAVFLLSGMEDEEEMAEFMKLGQTAGLCMGGVLRKPVDVDAVKTLLSLNMTNKLQVQAGSPLKKSLEFSHNKRTEKHSQTMNFDPDQLNGPTSCLLFDTLYKINNRQPGSHSNQNYMG